eukprot:EG_transcript_16556
MATALTRAFRLALASGRLAPLRRFTTGTPVAPAAPAIPVASPAAPIAAPGGVSPELRIRRKFSPFNVFLQQQKGKTPPVVLKDAVKLWGELTTEGKAEYVKLADKANENRPMVPKNPKRVPKNVAVIEKKSTPRPISGYLAFVKANHRSQPGVSNKERLSGIAKAWAGLDAEGRKKYDALAAEENAKRATVVKVQYIRVPLDTVQLPGKKRAAPPAGTRSPQRKPKEAKKGSASPSTAPKPAAAAAAKP